MRELYSHTDSSVHRLDARVKVIFTLAFLLFLNLTPARAWPAYIFFLTIVVSITLISRVGLGFVNKRALLALPFVAAAFPLIFFGPQLRPWIPFPNGPSIAYNPAGLERFISIAIKAWISVQISILLAATTRFPDLTAAFQQLKVPQLFIAIISLMWRYLFVIIDEAARLMRARSSRSAAAAANSGRAGGSVFWRARVTGGLAGSLFLRSIERSERVYAAMVSRGYNGDVVSAETCTLSFQERGRLTLGILLLGLIWVFGILCGG